MCVRETVVFIHLTISVQCARGKPRFNGILIQMKIHTMNCVNVIVSITLVFLLQCLDLVAEANKGKGPRDDRLLNIFQIVRFPNQACNTSGTTEGVCYTSEECQAKGGSATGSCASGFGVCCSFSVGCGSTVSENNTYFRSTSFSTPCVLTVCKCSTNICQLRLDFDTFVLAQPTTGNAATELNTQCLDAVFLTSSNGPTPPALCGTNTGKHMYLEASDACNTLQVTTADGVTGTDFNIQIIQIPCEASYKAPEGCLQYFTGLTGTISNYNSAEGTHLSDHNYANCIRTEEGYCQITYTATIFALSGVAAAAASGTSCSTDYITLVGSPADRFCGGTLATMPSSTTPPFIVGVILNAGEAAVTSKSTGFTLTYAQSMTQCA